MSIKTPKIAIEIQNLEGQYALFLREVSGYILVTDTNILRLLYRCNSLQNRFYDIIRLGPSSPDDIPCIQKYCEYYSKLNETRFFLMSIKRSE